MHHNIIKTIVLFGLSFCLVSTAFAQKNKIKGNQKAVAADSTKADSLPTAPVGKASLKTQLAVGDSALPQVADSLRASTAPLATAAQDSLQSGTPDSLKKPRKRFYTRVKNDQLLEAENRSAALRRRVEMAEARLAASREDAAAGNKDAFSTEELEAFAVSIAMAQKHLVLADSALMAMRTKLTAEGRLGQETAASGEAGEPGEEDLDGDDDSETDLPDPAVISGGKGGIKTQPAEPGGKGGKGNIKGKQQEEDIDND